MTTELSELENQFFAWRQTKTSRVTQVPLELIDKVLAQLASHSKSKIMSELNLSGVMLQRWQKAKKENLTVPEYSKIVIPADDTGIKKKEWTAHQIEKPIHNLAMLHFGTLKIEIQDFEIFNIVLQKILIESQK